MTSENTSTVSDATDEAPPDSDPQSRVNESAQPAIPALPATPERPFEKFIYQENGIDALIMCGENPRRAVISFSSMNPGKYERWSWFHERHEAGGDDLYIIFKDDDHHYYIGSDSVSMHIRHHRFISEQLQKHGLSTRDMYMVGSSMGGYAALYFGFWMNCAGVIVTNPQIDYQSTRRHSLRNWERQIREAGVNWVDINDYIYRFSSTPSLYIEHGDYPADVAAVQKLVVALEDRKLTYTRSFVGGDHSTTSMDREKLFNIIDFWRQ